MFGTCNLSSQSGWFWQNPLPQENTLHSIHFTDANNGWAVGDNGTILHTTNGGVTYVRETSNEIIPTDIVLYQNYPNPFNPTTTIKFSIPTSEIVKITVFDILGKEVRTLVDDYKTSGIYEVEFNSHSDEGQNLPAGRQGLPSGVYFYKLQAGKQIEMKKMVF